jgi:hypothetical protein
MPSGRYREQVIIQKERQMNYIEYQKKIDLLSQKLDKPPFFSHFGILEGGSFVVKEETVLGPEEALRLGKWLTSFYDGADGDGDQE